MYCIVLYSFEYWALGQPDGSGDCIVYNMLYIDSYWDDVECSGYADDGQSRGFICEADTAPQTTTLSPGPGEYLSIVATHS